MDTHMADLVALEPLSESPDSVDENRGFSFKQRLVVVMDLDNTCLDQYVVVEDHEEASPDIGLVHRNWWGFRIARPDFLFNDEDHTALDAGRDPIVPGLRAVWIRPGLDDFFYQVRQFAEVLLWTAGAEEAVGETVRLFCLRYNISLSNVFYKAACDVALDGTISKSLPKLEFLDLTQTVLVDDDLTNYYTNADNCIPTMIPFSIDQPTLSTAIRLYAADDELLTFTLPFLQRLASMPDVRRPMSRFAARLEKAKRSFTSMTDIKAFMTHAVSDEVWRVDEAWAEAVASAETRLLVKRRASVNSAEEEEEHRPKRFKGEDSPVPMSNGGEDDDDNDDAVDGQVRNESSHDVVAMDDAALRAAVAKMISAN